LVGQHYNLNVSIAETGDDRAMIYGALLWMTEKLQSDQGEHARARWTEKGKAGVRGWLDSKPFPHFPGLCPFVAGYPVDQFFHYRDKSHLERFVG
jgi:hypothetical protein